MVAVSVKQILKVLKKDGWYQVSQVGSHRQFKHTVKAGKVTLAGQPSDIIPTGTLLRILKQAQLPKDIIR